MDSSTLKAAAQVIKEAHAILICAGAGMGVDSGLPDFRGPQGFWKAYPPIEKLGLAFEDMANPRRFAESPHLAWAFYGHRRNLYRETVPHEGFKMLLELGESKPGKYFVFTSNVDSHFQKAGFDPDRIVECHGAIDYMQCTKPCKQEIWKAEEAPIEIDAEKFKALDPLPSCSCGQLARPNILMFGDWHWLEHRTTEQEIRMKSWLLSLENKKLAIIELGAGTSIPTVRITSQMKVRKYNGILIRINPRESEVRPGGIAIEAGALEGLKAVFQYL
jgi:NAD-dependent SIR2 family protein deacetylase